MFKQSQPTKHEVLSIQTMPKFNPQNNTETKSATNTFSVKRGWKYDLQGVYHYIGGLFITGSTRWTCQTALIVVSVPPDNIAPGVTVPVPTLTAILRSNLADLRFQSAQKALE